MEPEADSDFWRVWSMASYAAAQWVDLSDQIEASVIKPHGHWWSGRRVVDLGCGAGEVTERMARAGALVTGVESCPALARVAQARLGRACVWLGDWCDYEPDGRVDVVTFWSSTFGIQSSQHALGRACGWLRPGGRVLVDVVDAAGLVARFRPVDRITLGPLAITEHRELDDSRRRVRVRWELGPGRPLGEYEFRLFDGESLLLELARAGFGDARLLEPYRPDRLVATAARPIASA